MLQEEYLVKMEYIKDGIIGSLRQLLPNISSPDNLSTEELEALGVKKLIKSNQEIKPWQKIKSRTYEDNQEVLELEDMPLENWKEVKIKTLKYNTLENTYKLYPQHKRDQILSTLMGVEFGYTLQEAQDIANWLKGIKQAIDDAEIGILNEPDYEGVDTYPNIITEVE